jgi:acyl phosphate:glycerol-3-phosphate acyltransferase
MVAALIVLGGYLLGSVPFGLWVVRWIKGTDIREQGSGNIGATNVWRVYGRWLGIPIVLLDVAKGFVPALVGLLVAGQLIGVLAGAAAMFGHWRPLYLRLAKGGKTVATAGGVTLALAPRAAGCCVAVWLVLFLVTRYSSIASLVTALTLPLFTWLFGAGWPVVTFGVLAAVAVLLLHKANIRRLFAGTESRFEFRKARRPVRI